MLNLQGADRSGLRIAGVEFHGLHVLAECRDQFSPLVGELPEVARLSDFAPKVKKTKGAQAT